jgi:hypothetical protein
VSYKGNDTTPPRWGGVAEGFDATPAGVGIP